MPEPLFLGLCALLLGCCGLCLFRIGRGPTGPDRMVK